MQRMASMMGGSREAESHTDYQPLPGGEFDDIGESQRAIDTAHRLRSTPSRKIHPLPRLARRFFFLTLRSPLHAASISGGIRQPDFSQDSGAGATQASAQNHGGNLIASCPKCASQLLIPPGVPTVACGSCGQAISPVVSGGHGAPAPPPGPEPFTKMVKCPLCAAVLQQPPGASLAVCGGCHQVIAMPGGENGGGGGQPQASGASSEASALGEGGMPPIIACPSCNMRLQPPPGAPLVACGGCRQVMQVPGVAQS